jgi:hypothetical protein
MLSSGVLALVTRLRETQSDASAAVSDTANASADVDGDDGVDAIVPVEQTHAVLADLLEALLRTDAAPLVRGTLSAALLV